MQRIHFLRSATAAFLALALGSPLVAQAQAWPTKSIRLIVNLPPGTSADVVARAIATPLSLALGQSVLIDNRSGASGTIGADLVAKAAPDGHTILLSAGSTMSITPHIMPRLSYDYNKDLMPVAASVRLQLFLVSRSGLPFGNYADFVKYAKANPGKLSYGTPGTGSSPHIAGEMLKAQAGIFAVHIPYRGSAPALVDLLGGSVDFAFDPGIAFQHVDSGRLRLLAVGSAKRSLLFPNTPTLAELGLTGFDVGTTQGIWAPAGTPPAIIERLNTEINRVLVLPAVVAAIRALGAEPTPMTPAQLSSVTQSDSRRYAAIIKERNIQAD